MEIEACMKVCNRSLFCLFQVFRSFRPCEDRLALKVIDRSADRNCRLSVAKSI